MTHLQIAWVAFWAGVLAGYAPLMYVQILALY
jgi:hypothetical protein